MQSDKNFNSVRNISEMEHSDFLFDQLQLYNLVIDFQLEI